MPFKTPFKEGAIERKIRSWAKSILERATRRRTFLHGQWVDVLVLPPQVAPWPTGSLVATSNQMDPTAYETKGRHDRKVYDPEDIATDEEAGEK